MRARMHDSATPRGWPGVLARASHDLATRFQDPVILEHDGGHVVAATPEIAGAARQFCATWRDDRAHHGPTARAREYVRVSSADASTRRLAACGTAMAGTRAPGDADLFP